MRQKRFRATHALAAIAIAVAGLLLGGTHPGIEAAEPTVSPDSTVTITVEPMLGGKFQIGAWAAIRVLAENSGPAVDGELRLGTTAATSSTYAIPVHLASGARQEHILYGPGGIFGGRYVVTVASGTTIHASQTVRIDSSSGDTQAVVALAENPQAFAGDLGEAAGSAARSADVVALRPQDLPPRVEAWAAVGTLVWQDVNPNSLDAAQLQALRTWVQLGGTLVIVGGSAGLGTLAGFPEDLLPFVPTAVVDMTVADLEPMLGTLPASATTTPALAGTLVRGTVLARSGDFVTAAVSRHGRGNVALIGIDPATQWIAGSSVADAYWLRALPSAKPELDALVDSDNGFLANALSNLPSIQLPRIEQLLVLIGAYVLAIGPLNYFILRRRDRLEWAWITMPATMVVFAVAAYGLGIVFKGADVIVNQLAIVQGATGSDTGVAHVQVGIYTPNRASFNVQVGGNSLLLPSSTNAFDGREEAPIDVLAGDPAVIRQYGVGFGNIRTFRAQAAVATPRVEADFRLVDDALAGSVTNVSGAMLDDVTVVYGGRFDILGDLAPGESRPIDLTGDARGFRESLAGRLVPGGFDGDPETVRSMSARRSLIQHLEGGWDGPAAGQGPFGDGPVVLVWQSGPTLPVEVGATAQQVGERLYVLPARAIVEGSVVFSGALVRHSGTVIDALDGGEERDGFYLNRGTITTDYRPIGFDGVFTVTGMSLRIGLNGPAAGAQGDDLLPLPADEQPDSDQPLASEPRPGEGDEELPRLQLFDLTIGEWVEFEPMTATRTYRIAEPARYVTSAGVFRARFVARDADAYAQFSLESRLEGDVR